MTSRINILHPSTFFVVRQPREPLCLIGNEHATWWRSGLLVENEGVAGQKVFQLSRAARWRTSAMSSRPARSRSCAASKVRDAANPHLLPRGFDLVVECRGDVGQAHGWESGRGRRSATRQGAQFSSQSEMRTTRLCSIRNRNCDRAPIRAQVELEAQPFPFTSACAKKRIEPSGAQRKKPSVPPLGSRAVALAYLPARTTCSNVSFSAQSLPRSCRSQYYARTPTMMPQAASTPETTGAARPADSSCGL